MVPLNRAMAGSYKLTVVTMSLFAAVWPQYLMPFAITHVR